METNMKSYLALAALAATIGLAAPALAQSDRWDSQGQNPNGWNGDRDNDRGDYRGDHNNHWDGAPTDAWRRITFLQQRIDRGRADGSLTRREAWRSTSQLNEVRRQASAMRQRSRGQLRPQDAAWLQMRLDTISREIRWARANGNDYADRGGQDRFATSYDARSYYRDGPQYAERRLSADDEVYRGSDGRYYCKRNDGTTGLIVGGVGGAVLGNVIDGGHQRAAGTLIGGALGAILGKTIDQNSTDVRCR
jgi:hypothetical protein